MIVDCEDPARLALFWAALLGWYPGGTQGPYVFVHKPGDAPGERGKFNLLFQKVSEPRRGKNRVHPDLITDDLHATWRRVLDLGGRRVSGYESGGFLVMADPEGNEFCLLPEGDLGMDENGNVNYLERLGSLPEEL